MKIFVTYSRSDRERIRRDIVDYLSPLHDVWYDDRLIAGVSFEAEIARQIQLSDILIFVITRSSVNSTWCLWEHDQAVKAGKRVIPVLMQKVPLPETLKHIQYVDFTRGVTGNAVRDLLTALTTASSSSVIKFRNNKPADISVRTGVKFQGPPSTPRSVRVSRRFKLILRERAISIFVLIGLLSIALVGFWTCTISICPPPLRGELLNEDFLDNRNNWLLPSGVSLSGGRLKFDILGPTILPVPVLFNRNFEVDATITWEIPTVTVPEYADFFIGFGQIDASSARFHTVRISPVNSVVYFDNVRNLNYNGAEIFNAVPLRQRNDFTVHLHMVYLQPNLSVSIDDENVGTVTVPQSYGQQILIGKTSGSDGIYSYDGIVYFEKLVIR